MAVTHANSLALLDHPNQDVALALASTYKMEPLNTPGIVPVRQKRAVIQRLPLLEILERLMYRLRPSLHLDFVLGALALASAGYPVYKFLESQFLQTFTSEVTIPENDPIAKEVLQWMSANVVAKSSTHAMIVSGTEATTADAYYNPMVYGRRGASVLPDSEDVQCMPPIGKKIFWVGMRPFMFSRATISTSGRVSARLPVDGSDGESRNTLRIKTLGWSLQPLQAFIKTCHDFSLDIKLKAGTTTVYFAGGRGGMDNGYGNWNCVTKSVRKLDTVDMDDSIKSELLRDAEDYYLPETKKFYADCGIPYRRGYLFFGPPGTGKSSFSAALAGHLRCDLYMINLAGGNVTDGGLHSLFLSLPKKCVVVIEDIDSAGINREDQKEVEEASKPPPPPQDRDRRRRSHGNMVTLSGLLNAIDGNASQEGRLLIMTSNNPEALDEALIRPGRIDKKIHFGFLGPASARNIYMRLIGRPAIASGKLTLAEASTKAATFAEQLPTSTFTPAQVQNFLQFCRNEPDKAISEVGAWAAKTTAIAAQGPPPSPDPVLAERARDIDQINSIKADLNGITKDLLNGTSSGDEKEEKDAKIHVESSN